jgi:hypothetical protein
MPLYYLVFDPPVLEQQIRPALTASRQQRSFAPCLPLITALLPRAQAFRERYHIAVEESLLDPLLRGIPFDRHVWQLLAGELLLIAAEEVPELPIPVETFCVILGSLVDAFLPRERFSAIQQACYGSQDLCFGVHYYRPENAGFNSPTDVGRLSRYLAEQRPEAWTVNDLAGLPNLAEEDRLEELKFARDSFPAFQALYRHAEQQGRALVVERL